MRLAKSSITPGWKDLPGWAAVGTGDNAAGTGIVLGMAQRAGVTVTEIDGSRVIMISQPNAVTKVILAAVKAVRPSAAISV